MLLLNTFVLMCVSLSFGHQHEHFPVCKQLESVFNNLCLTKDRTTNISVQQGIQGKRGAVGSKGEIGDRGPIGPPGVVDYERVGTQVDARVQPVVERHAAETKDLLLKIERLEEKIQTLERREGTCDVKYNNKCFWVVPLDRWVYGYDNLARLCSEKNGSPANIYSEEHYDMIMRYLTSKILVGKEIIAPWIGMRTNPTTGTVTLSDGTPAPFMKWYPRNPSRSPNHTHMSIVQRSPSSKSDVGIHNFPATLSRDGVLCEI